jgi:hypothetical protein
MRSISLFSSIACLYLATSTAAVDPEVVYNGSFTGNQDIKLTIGNGGAGQSGLVGGHTSYHNILLNAD